MLDEAALVNVLDACKRAGLFAIDTETDSTTPMLARLVGLSLSCRKDEGWYVPIAHSYLGAPGQLTLETVRSALDPLLVDPSIGKIGHHLKYDETVLRRHGFAPLQGVVSDTMMESYLLDPEGTHGLKELAKKELHVTMITYNEVTGEKGSKGKTFDQVSIPEAVPYACADADLSLQLHDVLLPKIEKQGLRDLLEQVEVPLSKVLTKMEMTGVLIDVERLRQLGETMRKRVSELEGKPRRKLAATST